MAKCVERQLADPIQIPATGTTDSQKRCPTPRPNRPPFPAFSQKNFNLGNGNGPLACDDRVRNNHPLSVCRNLVPQLDTLLSPLVADRGPDYGVNAPSCSYVDETVTMDSISNHFRGIAVSEESMLVSYSDCVVCGKSVSQIQSEAVNDYMNETTVLGETLADRETRKRAFLDGMSAGRFCSCQGVCRRRSPAMANGIQLRTITTTLSLVRSPSIKESRHAVQKTI